MFDSLSLREHTQLTCLYVSKLLHFRRIRDSTLELAEESLDVNLSGNSLKLRFVDGTLVPGLSIFETTSSVCLLVATTNSVHRIVFSHPNRLQGHVSTMLLEYIYPTEKFHFCGYCSPSHKMSNCYWFVSQ